MEDLSGGAEAERDTREWVTADEAAAMLHMLRKRVLMLSAERRLERIASRGSIQTKFLRRDIESWADFRNLRRQWLAKYPGGSQKRWTEKIDAETARRLFIGAKEAAYLLGVSGPTLRYMVRSGRLPCYQTVPKQRGSRLWFSRRAVLQLCDDEGRRTHRARYLKGLANAAGSGSGGMQLARTVRGGIPKGWLTTREAATRLGVKPSQIHRLRANGRLHGEQIWRRNKPLRFWYFPDYEVERLISWREEARELEGLPLLPVPGSLPPSALPIPIANALPIPPTPFPAGRARVPVERESMRLDAEGPEPKWACDDVDLTRAFFLMDRP